MNYMYLDIKMRMLKKMWRKTPPLKTAARLNRQLKYSWRETSGVTCKDRGGHMISPLLAKLSLI